MGRDLSPHQQIQKQAVKSLKDLNIQIHGVPLVKIKPLFSKKIKQMDKMIKEKSVQDFNYDNIK